MKIFYTNRQAISDDFILYVLAEYFHYKNTTIKRTKNGKPYIVEDNIFFSISHSATHTFLVVANKPIGLDVEPLNRKTKYAAILKKFSLVEQSNVQTTQDFLRLWTIKESVIKYLGGSIARDLDKINYENEQVFYNNTLLPVIVQTAQYDTHIISICMETMNKNLEFVDVHFV